MADPFPGSFYPGETGPASATEASVMAFRRMLISDVATLRGVNWYGMEDGLRGPNLAELQGFVSRGYNIVRLPVAYGTTNAAIAAVLADADTAGIWVGVEVHNFGRIGGTASITATDGTVIDSSNQSTWFTKCTDQLTAFQQYTAYVPLDMNEPKQTGSQWEPISQGRVTALRNAGWTGVIGVSAAKVSSAGGINNSDAHPGGWWITDSNSFLEVHHYLQPLSDATLQTRTELNNWVVTSSGQSDLTTYAQYIARAFYFGAMGDSRWTNVPMLIGEFAMPPGMETELDTFLDQVDARQVGACEWGAGMWPGTYAWLMTAAQYDVLSAHVVTPAKVATLSDTFSTLSTATWSTSGTPTPTVSSGRLSIALSTSYPTISSTGYFDLTGSRATVELVQAPNSGPSTQAFLTLFNQGSVKNGLEFVLDAATTLRARRWVNGSATEVGNVAFSPTSHRWWRIAEANGTLSWQTSPDGATWSTLTSTSTSVLSGVDLTRLRVSLGAGHFQADANPGTALFDNLDPAPTTAPVTFRGVAEDNRGTAASAIVSKPAGVVESDLMLCVQVCDLNGSLAGMTAPSGWILRGSSSRSDVGFMKVWTKVAGPSEPTTYTFPDPGGAQDCAIILAATGQDPNSPIAAGPTFASGAASTSHPAPSVAGVANGMLVTAHAAGTGGTTRSYTPPSGMTERQESGASSGAMIVLEVNTLALSAAGQTGTKTATCSGSEPYVTMSLVIAPVTAAVTASPGAAGGTGAALFGGVSSHSFALIADAPVGTTGKANAPTVAGTSRTTATAGRGSTTGKANNPSVSTTSTSATTVLAGLAGATGAALGSNTGAAFGFQVTAATPPGSGGVFPSDHLFPSDSLFPSDGGGAAPQTVTAVGIPSAEAMGSPVVTLADGPLFVQAAAIDSAEAFGVPTVTAAAGPQDITAVGIGSAEAFGRPTVTPDVAPPPPAPHAEYFDTYFVDGVDLSTYTTQIEVGEGLQDTPGTVGDNVALPGMDGALEVFGGPGQPRRPDGQGRLTLDMWLIGVDPDTGELLDRAGTAQAYQQRWDELVRMFHRRRVLVDHPRTDGTRRALAHLVPGETMAPSNRSASPWFGRFRVSLAIPGAHWTDLTEVTTGPTSLITNGMLDLGLFATATAPCTELTITFGPGNNPRLSTSYGFVGYNGVIAAGRQLTINTATGELGSGSGQLWTPSYDGLIYSPGPRLFEIDPSEPLQAILTHTTGGTMSVEVAGKRRYRTS